MENTWKRTCSVPMLYICLFCFVIGAASMTGVRGTGLEEQVIMLRRRLEKLEKSASSSGGHASFPLRDGSKCPDVLCQRVIGDIDTMRIDIASMKMNLTVESNRRLQLEKQIDMLRKLSMRRRVQHNAIMPDRDGLCPVARMLNKSHDSHHKSRDSHSKGTPCPSLSNAKDADRSTQNRDSELTKERLVNQNSTMTSLVSEVQDLKVNLTMERTARIGLREQVRRMRHILRRIINRPREQTMLNKSMYAIPSNVDEAEQHTFKKRGNARGETLINITDTVENTTERRDSPIDRNETDDTEDVKDKKAEDSQIRKTNDDTGITNGDGTQGTGHIAASSSAGIKQYRDCWDVQTRGGYREDGVYEITPIPGNTTVRVRCDMSSSGGGWTIFQRRIDGSLDFENRTLDAYSNGFGDPSKEHWLGLEWVHLLTSGTRPHSLRVDICDWAGESRFAEYTRFSVDSSDEKYRLHIANYNGTAGNSLNYKYKNVLQKSHNERLFQATGKCARMYHGGWWYHDCHFANLNGGLYKRRTGTWQGIQWRLFRSASNLASSEMKLRPAQIAIDSRDVLRKYICPSK